MPLGINALKVNPLESGTYDACVVRILDSRYVTYRSKENFSTVFVLKPSAGTYTYSVAFAVTRNSKCFIRHATLLVQVVK